ncbi:hypothetical protein CRG98_042286 [Punica granatum]|uniref:Uncharacterized protein n=1 Tax=Punica granatum TaxID=22663 RepID=A0A2I0I024_PUNGR|nr:hypothetical protein CRG98_042286 [Punica granatum]
MTPRFTKHTSGANQKNLKETQRKGGNNRDSSMETERKTVQLGSKILGTFALANSRDKKIESVRLKTPLGRFRLSTPTRSSIDSPILLTRPKQSLPRILIPGPTRYVGTPPPELESRITSILRWSNEQPFQVEQQATTSASCKATPKSHAIVSTANPASNKLTSNCFDGNVGLRQLNALEITSSTKP